MHTVPSSPDVSISFMSKQYSQRRHLPQGSNQLLQPLRVSFVLGLETFSLPVLRFLALIAAPVFHPPYLGNISVEAHATAISLAGALEDVEMYPHDLRPSTHWSWMHCHLHLFVASRYSLGLLLKAFLQTTER